MVIYFILGGAKKNKLNTNLDAKFYKYESLNII